MKKISILILLIVTLLNGKDILLKKGWNLKGTAYEIDLKSINSKCFDGFWKYKNGWSYIKTQSDNILEKDSGFWVRAKEDCSFLPIYSNSQKNDFIQIKNGWNLIGITKEEWFSNIDKNFISNAFIYSTDKSIWSDFLINQNNSFLLEKDRGIWIKSTKDLKLNYLEVENKNILKGKLIINDEIWDSANVVLNGINAEGKSDINGNFIIKDLSSQDECLNLTATKEGYEQFKTKVKRNLQNGITLCKDDSNINNNIYFAVESILKSISISKANLNLKIGETYNLKVMGKYTNDSQKDETVNASFKLSNEDIISIDGAGVIRAKSEGDTQLTATVGEFSTTINIEVKNVLESISIVPNTLNLQEGDSYNLKVIGVYSDNSQVDETNNTTFRLSNENILSIDESGVVSAKSEGSGEVIATIGDLSSSLTIEVKNILESISVSITPSTLTLIEGETANLKVLENYSNGLKKDKTLSATFTSLNENIISTNNSSLISALSVGSASIKVEMGNFSKTINLNVIAKDTIIQGKNLIVNYSDLIAPNATIEKFDEKRFCILKGKIKNIDDTPLSNVQVSINEYPEYGSVESDINGEFAIAIEGGSSVTLRYQKDGFSIVDRQIDAPWNDIAIANDITMLRKDSKVTPIKLDGTKQVHSSSVYSDDRGARATTLVFNGVTKATVIKEDGSTEELSDISVRATEFITPESMPANLPPQSAYTFCADLTIDEVADSANVEFDKPIVMYVNNFLGFDIGEIVPVGYYDRQKGVWRANDNGVVVKLLDGNGDGIVDSLDSDGDGVANDLNGDGNISDEVEGLEDSTTYKAGESYWRVEISHFTPWDCNWPYGPPDGAEAPSGNGVSSDNSISGERARTGGNSGNSNSGNGGGRDRNNCQVKTNSYIEPTDRSFHEDIPIAGTNLTLHYSSKRVEGYKHQVTIPIENVPNSVESIKVTMSIAGKEYEKTLPPESNQIVEFIWDGRDFRNRIVNGKIKAKITISYTYKAVYYKSSQNWEKSFAQIGSEATFVRARSNIDLSKNFEKELVNSSRRDIANGWSLSNHNKWLSAWEYENGRGEIKTIYSIGTVEVIAGNGISSFCGDGGKATEACLNEPMDIKFDNMGNLYFSDGNNNRVRKIDRDGIITTVVSNVNYSRGIAIDKFGNIYMVENNSGKIFKYDTNGAVSLVAGGGCGINLPYEDGKLAIDVCLSYPDDVELDNMGNLYIANSGRVKRVDTSGIIRTFIGDGSDYYSNNLAGLKLDTVQDIKFDKFGNIYILTYSKMIKMDMKGSISFITKKTYPKYYCGDGGLAIDACLYTHQGKFTLDDMGNIYIADEMNNLIRKINTNGIISTVVGNLGGICKSDGLANEVCLNRPAGVAIDNEGNLYISDSWNRRILKVSNISDSNALIVSDNTLYEFNENFNHSKTIDLATKKELNKFVYDDEGRLIASIDNFNNQITINRDENGKVTSITSPNGHITTLSVDENNNLISVGYEDNRSYNFTYSDGLMTAMIKPNGESFYHNFNDFGRIVSTSDPEGGVWSFSKSVDKSTNTIFMYTPEGDEKQYITIQHLDGSFENSTILPSGEKTSTTISADSSNITSVGCEVNTVSKFDYDNELKENYISKVTTTLPSNLTKVVEMNRSYEGKDFNFTSITRSITLNSKTTITTHDINNSKFIITSPENRVVTNYYDSETLLPIKDEIAGLLPTEYSYDLKGRLISTKVGDRNSSYSYSDRGNVESFVDSKGLTTNYEYDLLDRVTKVIKPTGDELHFSYDPMGAMTMLKVPTTAEHNFTYNSLGKNTSYITPLSRVTTYKYDKDRRLIETLLDSNKSILYSYSGGKLNSISTPDWQINYSYACLSNIASITKGGEKLEYSYDGELTTAIIQSGILNKTINFSYNNDFDISSITYAGITNNLSYDLDGLLTSSSGFSINRNALNGLAESMENGTFRVDRTFNGYSEIDSEAFSINSTSFYSYEILARDEVGRVTSKRETLDGNITEWGYSYDDLGRLVEVVKNSVIVESYEYDSNGNRVLTYKCRERH